MLGGAAIGALGGIFQQDKQSDMADHAMDFTRDQTAAQMAFQERMRGSQYQTAVTDMQAAGLNPMLAYQQGGSGTPTGASGSGQQGQAQNIGQAAATAAASAAQIENLQAQTEKTKAETFNIKADVIPDDGAGGNRGLAGSPSTYSAHRVRNEAAKALEGVYLTHSQEQQVKQAIENAIKDGHRIDAHTGNIRVDTELANLRIPHATNLAEAEKSGFKKYVSPFLDDAGKVANSAGTIAARGQGLRTQHYIIHGK